MEPMDNSHQLKMAKTKQLLKLKEKEKESKQKLEKNYTRYKSELERLEQKYNGFLSTPDIVREATDSQNPLHDWFDWSDAEAGEKWRLHQARMLISSVRVKVMFEKGPKEYRRYVNVTLDRHNGSKPQRFYVNTKTAINTENLKQQILQRAMKEADYWQRCYEDYLELQDIFVGIEKTKKKLIKKKLLVTSAEIV